MTSTRGPVLMLSALAVLLVAAGVLPWVAGGSGVARGFAAPLLVVGVFAGYAVFRASRAPAAAAPAPARTSQDAGCGGCQCGAGGCGAAPPNQSSAG